MSGNYIGVFGIVKSINAVGSSTEIVISLPVRYHPDYRKHLYQKNVVVTLGEHPEGYGVYVDDLIVNEPIETDRKAPYGDYYRELYRCGFFNNLAACAAFGSDEDYQAFVRLQPSCKSGDFDEYLYGEGRSVYAHVRRANNSGTGMKPVYMGIPLTSNEHYEQHHYGESYFDTEDIGGDEFFMKQAEKYRTKWMKSVMYKDLNVESLAEVKPKSFLKYAEKKGFAQTLPRKMVNLDELAKWETTK